MPATHFATEILNCAWLVVTIMSGTHAIGEFMVTNSTQLPSSPSIPLRARFVHVWGQMPRG